MSPRTFIHFAATAAFVVDLATLSTAYGRTCAVVCHPEGAWSESLGVWFAQRGLDLEEVLPSPGATNSPQAPSWASVPDELIAALTLGASPLDRLRLGDPVRMVINQGEYWLAAGDLAVRIPRALLCDLDQAALGQAA